MSLALEKHHVNHAQVRSSERTVYKGHGCRYSRHRRPKPVRSRACTDVKNRRGKQARSRKVTGVCCQPGAPGRLLVTSNDSRVRLYHGYALRHKFKGPSNRRVEAACWSVRKSVGPVGTTLH